jgi:hypothetical protein
VRHRDWSEVIRVMLFMAFWFAMGILFDKLVLRKLMGW